MPFVNLTNRNFVIRFTEPSFEFERRRGPLLGGHPRVIEVVLALALDLVAERQGVDRPPADLTRNARDRRELRARPDGTDLLPGRPVLHGQIEAVALDLALPPNP